MRQNVCSPRSMLYTSFPVGYNYNKHSLHNQIWIDTDIIMLMALVILTTFSTCFCQHPYPICCFSCLGHVRSCVHCLRLNSCHSFSSILVVWTHIWLICYLVRTSMNFAHLAGTAHSESAGYHLVWSITNCVCVCVWDERIRHQFGLRKAERCVNHVVYERRAYATQAVALSSPVSAVHACDAWDHDPRFDDQTASISWLGRSFGSPSNYETAVHNKCKKI